MPQNDACSVPAIRRFVGRFASIAGARPRRTNKMSAKGQDRRMGTTNINILPPIAAGALSMQIRIDRRDLPW